MVFYNVVGQEDPMDPIDRRVTRAVVQSVYKRRLAEEGLSELSDTVCNQAKQIVRYLRKGSNDIDYLMIEGEPVGISVRTVVREIKRSDGIDSRIANLDFSTIEDILVAHEDTVGLKYLNLAYYFPVPASQ